VTEHTQVNNEVNNTCCYVDTLLRVTHSSRRPSLGMFLWIWQCRITYKTKYET